MTRHAAALGGAAALLVAIPWIMLARERPDAPATQVGNDAPLVIAPAADIAPLLDRPPFGSSASSGAATPDEGDTPHVVGIVGRLPDRAVVLVRTPDGGTLSLSIGDMAGRWKLLSIGADAALFGDGAHRARVELPAGDQ